MLRKCLSFMAFSAVTLLALPAVAQAQDEAQSFDFSYEDLFLDIDPVFFGFETAEASPDVTTVVDGMQKFYEDTKAFSADFQQTVTDVSGGTQEQSGSVFFLKPGRMRWDYKTPEEKFFISNGSTFWIWEPAYNQYCEQSLQDSQLPTALTFLTGQGDIRTDFDVKLLKSSDIGHHLELTPKVPATAYVAIEFVVDLATFQVKEVTIINAVDSENHLVFVNPEINDESITEDKFGFAPPEDATMFCKAP